MEDAITVRPYKLGIDTQEACELEAAAFTEDYRRMGEDPRLEASRECRVEKVLAWASRIVPSLRFARMGYVAEQTGRISSVVLFRRDGLKGTRWTIDAVGTHPEFQRQGLARRLIGHAFETIHTLGGEACTLKVRQDNAAAYQLYRSLGFAHFHTSRQMKREKPCRVEKLEEIPEGLATVEAQTWHSMWRERLDLARRSTPAHVQEYKPVLEAQFRRTRMIRALGTVVVKLSGFRIHRWVLRAGGDLIATLVVREDQTGNRSHELRVDIDPQWSSRLARGLIRIGLGQLSEAPSSNVLIEVGGYEASLLEALSEEGFEEMSTWHWLGACFTQTQEALGVIDSVTV